jgi:hypothetical protein
MTGTGKKHENMEQEEVDMEAMSDDWSGID